MQKRSKLNGVPSKKQPISKNKVKQDLVPSFSMHYLKNIQVEDAIWPQIQRVQVYLQKLKNFRLNQNKIIDASNPTTKKAKNISLPDPRTLFSSEIQEIITKTIGRGMFSSLETSTLSHQNFDNFLLHFWISLSSSLPVQKIMMRGHFLCEVCLKQQLEIFRIKAMTGVHKIPLYTGVLFEEKRQVQKVNIVDFFRIVVYNYF